MSFENLEQGLLTAIDHVHGAAIGEMSWSLALEAVCDVLGARAADLNMFDADTLDYLAFHPARVDPFVLTYIADYMSDVTHENPRVAQLYLPMAEGRIVADSDVWTTRELGRMPFFADFLQPWGTFDSLNTWVRRRSDGSPLIALAVHYRKQDCPPQAEHRRRLAMLLPHIRRACATAERLDEALLRVAGLEQAIEHAREPIVLLSEGARILHASGAARALLQRERGLFLGPDETLRFRSTAHQDALRAALRRCRPGATALQDAHASPSARIVIPQAGGAPLVLTVQPLPGTRRHHSAAVAALFIHAPQQVGAHEVGALREAYGLTPAEIQVVCGLVNGTSLKKLAQQREISYETVRSQLRQIFAKTGTHRQSALVGLVRGVR
ncbi:helix-turn-helix transcriptional regulator [Variovorax paradoxus]|uniref:helix-turn-helix transcriptional regulator n=1 Tax=Variovorax paradoxus TaxID=34073 RepID=UPI001934023B|nr:helix-turn-helix transcriptional regulator [Variovorax paradoxus]